MDWTQMIGNLLGSAAGMPIKRKPNGPPTPTLLPSQQAVADVHDGITASRYGTPMATPDTQNMPVVNTGRIGTPDATPQVNTAALAPVADENGNSPAVDPSAMPVQATPGQSPLLSPPSPTMPTGEPDAPPSNVGSTPWLEGAVLDSMKIHSSPWKDLGAGLIQGADNFFNHKDTPIRSWGEIKRDKKLGVLMPQLKIRQEQDAARIRDAQDQANIGYTKARTATIGADDARLEEAAKEKARHNGALEDYWKRKADQGDLKLASEDELNDLKDKWATSKDVNDKKRLDLVEEEQKNRMTRNQNNNQTRRDIAGAAEGGKMTRMAIATQAGFAKIQLQKALSAGQQAEAQQWRAKLMELKAQDDAAKAAPAK